MINIQYETFLRNDICGGSETADEIIEAYENDEKQRRYIFGCLEAYIRGQISSYQCFNYLYINVIAKNRKAKEMQNYLNEEYKEKMR